MRKFKQIMAIAAIIILVLMYILSLIFAILKVDNWQRMFFASMGATIIIPAFIWLNLILFRAMEARRETGDGEVTISHRKK